MSAPDTEPNNKADHPGVIAPPPLIFIVGLGIGVGLNARCSASASTHLPAELLFLTASALLIAGFTLIVRSTNRFHLAKTNARPCRAHNRHRHRRHLQAHAQPDESGDGLHLCRPGRWRSTIVAALIVLLPVLFVVDRYVIQREERYLEAKFGAEYLAYKTKVRRWL